jgi:hypothetical protein
MKNKKYFNKNQMDSNRAPKYPSMEIGNADTAAGWHSSQAQCIDHAVSLAMPVFFSELTFTGS